MFNAYGLQTRVVIGQTWLLNDSKLHLVIDFNFATLNRIANGLEPAQAQYSKHSYRIEHLGEVKKETCLTLHAAQKSKALLERGNCALFTLLAGHFKCFI